MFSNKKQRNYRLDKAIVLCIGSYSRDKSVITQRCLPIAKHYVGINTLARCLISNRLQHLLGADVVRLEYRTGEYTVNTLNTLAASILGIDVQDFKPGMDIRGKSIGLSTTLAISTHLNSQIRQRQ